MNRELEQAYREAARTLHQKDGKIEIDDGAKISGDGEEGAYVAAWVWVPKEEVSR